MKLKIFNIKSVILFYVLDRCYDKYFYTVPPSLSRCSLAYGDMQNNEMLQIRNV